MSVTAASKVMSRFRASRYRNHRNREIYRMDVHQLRSFASLWNETTEPQRCAGCERVRKLWVSHLNFRKLNFKFLLDEEFCKGYHEGILIKCAHGVERLVYPRILTYSADYPEKWMLDFIYLFSRTDPIPRVLIATIRDQGVSPCPRCTITKPQISTMGTLYGMTRREELACKNDRPRLTSSHDMVVAIMSQAILFTPSSQ